MIQTPGHTEERERESISPTSIFIRSFPDEEAEEADGVGRVPLLDDGRMQDGGRHVVVVVGHVLEQDDVAGDLDQREGDADDGQSV